MPNSMLSLIVSMKYIFRFGTSLVCSGLLLACLLKSNFVQNNVKSRTFASCPSFVFIDVLLSVHVSVTFFQNTFFRRRYGSSRCTCSSSRNVRLQPCHRPQPGACSSLAAYSLSEARHRASPSCEHGCTATDSIVWYQGRRRADPTTWLAHCLWLRSARARCVPRGCR